MKKVLILGAGLVVRPMVKHLLNKGIRVTVATRTKSKAEEMIAGHHNGTAIAWTVDDEETLSHMVADHDLVVSLLPYLHHLLVAKYCLLHKKNMVTTSYVKPEMQALDAEDIANAVAWLVSDAARYVTGVALPVDAGFVNKR